MKVVIIGAGEVGAQIARQLIEEKKDVILIEKDPEKVKQVSASLDCIVIQGEGTSIEVLRAAGVARADAFIAATTVDEVNLISCFIASELNVPLKIARVRNFEYSKSRMFTKRLSGVDFLVNPDIEAALEIAATVEQGATSSVTIFHNTDIQFRDFYIEEGSIFVGKHIQEIRSLAGEDFIIGSVIREGELIIPAGDFIVNSDDVLYIVAHKKIFNRLMSIVGTKATRIKSVAIVGGGSIGVAVADMLLSKGRSVVLIDSDYNRCKYLADEIPEALVLHGDISEKDMFEVEQLKNVDAIVTTTKHEELNILAGVYAKTLGIKHAVALVGKTSYLSIAAQLGIDSTISPKFSAVGAMLKYVRKGNVRGIHSLFDGQAEAIEYLMTEKTPIVGIKLHDIGLPPDCLVVAIDRRSKSILPHGDTVLEPGDNVVFFALRNSIHALEELLT